MQILIFSFSLSSILLGWDGLGITSFFLIIYYHNVKSLGAGIVTILTNRLGDCFIMFSISLIIETGTWNNYAILEKNFFLSLFLIIASFTKRAQLPFSFWLPKAIAAPTPVSSLVHSSTLVTAGVYVIYRYCQLIIISQWLLIFPLSTLIIGGLIAIKRFDCKEIIAYSTLRQIGFLVFVTIIQIKDQAFFHLIIHALFKSVLFMCRGYTIHLFNRQDVRILSTNISFPVKLSMLVSLSSMRGLPFLRGFYSKDLVLDRIIIYSKGVCLFLILIIIIVISSLYRFRLIFYLSSNFSLSKSWEWDYIILAVIFLINFSVISGRIYQWINLNTFYNRLRTFKFIILILFLLRIIRSWFLFFKLHTFKYLKLFNSLLLNGLIVGKFLNSFIEQGWLISPLSLLTKTEFLSKITSVLWTMFIILSILLFFLIVN